MDRENLIDLVRAAGQEIIDRAEDMVGTGDYISDLNLWVRFPPNEMPTVEVQREHLIGNSFDVLK